MLFTLLTCLCVPQDAPASRPQHLEVALEPGSSAESGPRWSPKGATVPLQASEGRLVGTFALGERGTPPVAVVLAKSKDATHFDRLGLDSDRDGACSESEWLTTTPKDQRGKWWSSFQGTVAIPVPATGTTPASKRLYPLSLWFVEDPAEPTAPPALRWSRRGWCEGRVEIAGKPAYVLVTEMVMDGVFDQRDAWALARDRKAIYSTTSRSMESHVWVDGVAWRPSAIDPHGRSLRIEVVHPATTEAEELAKADVYKFDREAPRAAVPLVFGSDLGKAFASAQEQGKRVFVDFQTTWCGPCRQMEALVYPAAAVVKAAEGAIAVKLDGDEQRELVKRYAVGGYPTMILLEADGKEVRRAVGYRGVAEMVRFFER